MTPAAWFAAAGIVANIVTAIFVYGKLTQKVKGHDKDIERVEERQDRTDARVDVHNGEIGELYGRLELRR